MFATHWGYLTTAKKTSIKLRFYFFNFQGHFWFHFPQLLQDKLPLKPESSSIATENVTGRRTKK